ncbi:hypothetical protein HNY73_015476 [Argiope bruennichi]|uniref:Uncharacterized protein n=1 Tax=Argiope bruennichi TaxID=94029 RepID=A0A8T0EU53_ARGBR|nr:hypothetical protein HNY73_015476 [Argiope bruennichi]
MRFLPTSAASRIFHLLLQLLDAGRADTICWAHEQVDEKSLYRENGSQFPVEFGVRVSPDEHQFLFPTFQYSLVTSILFPKFQVFPDEHQFSSLIPGTPDEHQVLFPKFQVSPDEHQVLFPKFQVSPDEHQVLFPKFQVSPDEHQVLFPKFQVFPDEPSSLSLIPGIP